MRRRREGLNNWTSSRKPRPEGRGSLLIMGAGSVLTAWEVTQAVSRTRDLPIQRERQRSAGHALYSRWTRRGWIQFRAETLGHLHGRYGDGRIAAVRVANPAVQRIGRQFEPLHRELCSDAAGGGTNLTTLSSGNPALYSVNLGVAGNLVKGLAPSLFSMNLADETGMAFSSVALPGNQAPSLNSFNVNRWTLAFTNGETLVGSLDTLKSVPLPATILLFGVGLIVLVGLGARGSVTIPPSTDNILARRPSSRAQC